MKYLLKIDSDYINYLYKRFTKINNLIVTKDNAYLDDEYTDINETIFYIDTNEFHNIIEILKTCDEKTVIIKLYEDDVNEFKEYNKIMNIKNIHIFHSSITHSCYIINNFMVTDLEYQYFFSNFATTDFKPYLRNIKIKHLV